MDRVAVVSDIHGNRWALEAVLDDLQTRTVDMILNLGDVFYGPLDPAGTYALLSSVEQFVILGNQDRILIESTDESNPTLQFVRSQLSEAALAWIKTWPATLSLDNTLFLCHGTPDNDAMYLAEEIETGHAIVRKNTELISLIAGIDEPVILCGHSHISRWIQFTEGRFLLNPGSVGLPSYADDAPVYHKMEAGAPYAAYAILNLKDAAPQGELIHVPYDYESAVRAAMQQGRADWAGWLKTGRA